MIFKYLFCSNVLTYAYLKFLLDHAEQPENRLFTYCGSVFAFFSKKSKSMHPSMRRSFCVGLSKWLAFNLLICALKMSWGSVILLYNSNILYTFNVYNLLCERRRLWVENVQTLPYLRAVLLFFKIIVKIQVYPNIQGGSDKSGIFFFFLLNAQHSWKSADFIEVKHN